MNTTLTQRLSSLTFAFVLTLGMLFGVNGLATSDVSEAQMARIAATHQV
ncbi:MAG: hypothetical protein JNJ71_04150 [Rubrivivax sp.]|nr:hypothetical protein [Rubrivivax sp.]